MSLFDHPYPEDPIGAEVVIEYCSRHERNYGRRYIIYPCIHREKIQQDEVKYSAKPSDNKILDRLYDRFVSQERKIGLKCGFHKGLGNGRRLNLFQVSMGR